MYTQEVIELHRKIQIMIACGFTEYSILEARKRLAKLVEGK